MPSSGRTYGVYAVKDDIKEYLAAESYKVSDDNLLLKFCMDASRLFDSDCSRPSRARWFYPLRKTLTLDHPGEDYFTPAPPPNVNAPTDIRQAAHLNLKTDVLEVEQLVTQNGITTVAAADYYLTRGSDRNARPYDTINLNPTGAQKVFNWTGTPLGANTVTGIYGYHEMWEGAFVELDTVQAAALTVGATQVQVADADGVDEYGIEGRFKVQQLLRIGDGESYEFAYLTGVNNSTNILTLIRAVNGTVELEHAIGTKIYVYRPLADIVQAIKVLAVHSYRRRPNIGNTNDRIVATPTGTLLIPNKKPVEYEEAVKRYRVPKPIITAYGNEGLTDWQWKEIAG